MRMASIILFRSHGSTTSTSMCISSNPAPRQRHAGRRTDASKRARTKSPAAIWRGALFSKTAAGSAGFLKRLVPALVVKRTGRGTQHLAEILGVGVGFVGIHG